MRPTYRRILNGGNVRMNRLSSFIQRNAWQGSAAFLSSSSLASPRKTLNFCLARAAQRDKSSGCVGNASVFSRYGSGERTSDGSWNHWSNAAGAGVGGTADGCIYTTTGWSNC